MRTGDRWRFNVFRIERPGGPEAPQKDGVFAAWSPPSVKTFHDAGAFRDLVFEGPRLRNAAIPNGARFQPLVPAPATPASLF